MSHACWPTRWLANRPSLTCSPGSPPASRPHATPHTPTRCRPISADPEELSSLTLELAALTKMSAGPTTMDSGRGALPACSEQSASRCVVSGGMSHYGCVRKLVQRLAGLVLLEWQAARVIKAVPEKATAACARARAARRGAPAHDRPGTRREPALPRTQP